MGQATDGIRSTGLKSFTCVQGTGTRARRGVLSEDPELDAPLMEPYSRRREWSDGGPNPTYARPIVTQDTAQDESSLAILPQGAARSSSRRKRQSQGRTKPPQNSATLERISSETSVRIMILVDGTRTSPPAGASDQPHERHSPQAPRTPLSSINSTL